MMVDSPKMAGTSFTSLRKNSSNATSRRTRTAVAVAAVVAALAVVEGVMAPRIGGPLPILMESRLGRQATARTNAEAAAR
jgi:hypothetical protein